jgi:exonuclease VII large subunit
VYQEKLPRAFERSLREQKEFLVMGTHFLSEALMNLKRQAEEVEERFVRTVFFLEKSILESQDLLQRAQKFFPLAFAKMRTQIESELQVLEKRLVSVDPQRVLQLGYSLVRAEGQVVRSSHNIVVGDILEVELSRGKIVTEVKQVKK